MFTCDWDSIKKMVKRKSLKCFHEIAEKGRFEEIIKERPGSLFFPIFENEDKVKVSHKTRPISNVMKKLLEPLLYTGEKRVTYLRKIGVNCLLFIKDLLKQFPSELLKNLTIVALQEGYVLAEKENNQILLHGKLEDFYMHEKNATEKSELNLAFPELKDYILLLKKEGLKSIIYSQLKKLSPYPFLLLEAKALLLLKGFFEEESKLEIAKCKECSVLKHFEGCIDRASFCNFNGVKKCYNQNILCIVSILQAYRAYMGHVKSKLEAYEQFGDSSWEYVELVLTYYPLEAIFQFACAHLPTSSSYKGKLIDKMDAYLKELEKIEQKIENNRPRENSEVNIIQPEDAKEFLLTIRKLSCFIRTAIETSFSLALSPQNFLNFSEKLVSELNQTNSDSIYIRAYRRLLQNMLTKCDKLILKDSNVHIVLTSDAPEDFAAKIIGEPCLLNYYVDKIVDTCKFMEIDAVVAPEARGFIVGGIVADKLHKPFVMIRKAKEVSPLTIFEGQYYYGKVKFALEESIIRKHKKILIVDDDLLTGGTCSILINAMEHFGVHVVGVAVLIEWPQLGGRQKIKDYTTCSIVKAYNPFMEAEGSKKNSS